MRGQQPPTRVFGICMYAAALTIAAAVSACANAKPPPTALDRFQLWNGCQPMEIKVILDAGKARPGLPTRARG